MIQNAKKQEKKAEKAKEAPAALVEKKEEVTPTEKANTAKWANVQDFSQVKNDTPQEYSDVETDKPLSKKEQSDMLHAVSNSAFSELADDADPSRIPKTAD